MKLSAKPLYHNLLLWLAAMVALPLFTIAQFQVASAAPNSSDQVITIQADGDAYVNSQQSTTPFGLEKSLIVSEISTLLAVQNRSLLHFDLSKIPTGSIINQATLRLYQTQAQSDWLLNIDRLTQSWDESTVTFRTAPPATSIYTEVVASAVISQTVSWDVTDLVAKWQHQPFTFPNYGLQLRGETVINSSAGRVFASREATNPPELVVNFTPPASSIVIPFDESVVKVDGQCNSDEYLAAYQTEYIDLNGTIGKLYLKQNNDLVYACIVGARGTYSLRSFGLYLDRDGARERYAEAEDFWLQSYIAIGQNSSYVGTGAPVDTYQPATIEEWSAVAIPGVVLGNTTTPDVAEFQLPLSMVSTICGQPFGIALYHQDINDNGVTYGFPTRVGTRFPDSWVKALLERPNCPIRVCRESSAVCTPAATATVYDAASDTAYSVNSEGYVQNRAQILDSTPLWAILPVEQKPDYTLYNTSGDPQFVGAAAFDAGEMVLVVTGNKPLQVQNLSVTAEWYVEGDIAARDWITHQLQLASDYLYKFSDRQFALGTITVQQSFDGWEDAQVRLHLNNVFQPRAVIGGVVPTTTVDPSPAITVTYSPGAINMGSYWNRYGKPPGQTIMVNGAPIDPAMIEEDWAVAMAHELSHYLLFLFDTYVDVNGQQTDTCVGSAMGDTYNPLNHGYIFSPDLWQTNCKQTIAYNLLQGRDEWDTIRTWYQWIQAPSAILSGTIRPPVDLTTVQFVTPTVTPGLPATNNVFDLGYQDSETASAEARAFIFRNDRLLEQGKPAKGSAQLILLDPQLGDRLCVYDLNDNSEGSETPRHQFGCEAITAGDALLPMTKNETWDPLVNLQQSASNVLQIIVSQTVPSGTVVRAILYPEYAQAISTIDLTSIAGGLQGTFVLTQPVPPVYVQLFVDEVVTGDLSRREVVFDRGTGGGGAFGPKSAYAGVQIISSDGNASFVPDTDIDLAEGESITWQSMPGTPPLPLGHDIVGQSYRLDAFPISLVEESGNVKLQFEQPAIGQDTSNFTIGFWNGTVWQALPTIIGEPLPGFHADGLSGAHLEAEDDVKLATAPSQGVGVYAVLLSGQQRLFLPLVTR